MNLAFSWNLVLGAVGQLSSDTDIYRSGSLVKRTRNRNEFMPDKSTRSIIRLKPTSHAAMSGVCSCHGPERA